MQLRTSVETSKSGATICLRMRLNPLGTESLRFQIDGVQRQAKPANTPITVHSGNGPISQSMPAPTPRPTATPARSRKATDSADADEPILSSSRLSSGVGGVTL